MRNHTGIIKLMRAYFAQNRRVVTIDELVSAIGRERKLVKYAIHNMRTHGELDMVSRGRYRHNAEWKPSKPGPTKTIPTEQMMRNALDALQACMGR